MKRNHRNVRRSSGEGKRTAIAYAMWCGLFCVMTAVTVHAMQRTGDIVRTGAVPQDSPAVIKALTGRQQQIDAAVGL